MICLKFISNFDTADEYIKVTWIMRKQPFLNLRETVFNITNMGLFHAHISFLDDEFGSHHVTFLFGFHFAVPRYKIQTPCLILDIQGNI